MPVVSTPANLLLIGEYAVTEENGLGIVLAVEPRVHIAIKPAASLTITGTTGIDRFSWPRDEAPLIECVVRECGKYLGQGISEPAAVPAAFHVDSSAFFEIGRGKTGLGSSAAVAAGTAYATLRASGIEGPELAERSFLAALAGHRAFQKGRGSGYDVAASFYGGVSLFHGGARPRVEHLSLPWFPVCALFSGERPVKTGDSVGRYQRWKELHVKSAMGFLAESNRCVRGFAASESWDEARTWFEACRDLGIWLGAQIGSPAELQPPEPQPQPPRSAWKSVGAGNELGILAMPPETSDSQTIAPKLYRPLQISLSGLTWVAPEGAP